MPTVREYFVIEAREHLAELRDLLAPDRPFDADALLRPARALRGGAQMAGDDVVAPLASALEAAAREIAKRTLARSAEIDALIRDTLSLLETLVEQPAAGADEGVAAVLGRWHDVGIRSAHAGPSGAGADAGADADAAEARATPADGVAEAFRAFAATEAEGIRAVLDGALDELRERPRDREPLKAILRRQRALLGAAALDSFPALAETLRAVDDATHLVARVKPAVTGEWLDPYIAARDVLAWAAPRIRRGDALDGEPEPLVRLRTARDRLFAARGDPEEAVGRPPADARAPVDISAADRAAFRREAVELLDRIARMASELSSAPEGRRAPLRRELHDAFTALSDNAHAFGRSKAAALALTGRSWLEAGDPAALDPLLDRIRGRIESDAGAEADEAAPGGPETAPVPIERLLYRGDAALRRALELRPALDAALADHPDAHATLDELFDLIRLALE